MGLGRILVLFCCGLGIAAAGQKFELDGRVVPQGAAAVTLNGVTTPFVTSTLAGADGRFRFKELLEGTYTLEAFLPGVGDKRQTVEIGPGTADNAARISVTVDLRGAGGSDTRGDTISLREFSIPDRARREYDDAQKKLSKRDVNGAIECLQRAVKLAPQFAAAWNNLGTIAFQTREYGQAEDCFRRALRDGPVEFAPLVNLGGVLLALRKFGEAWKYNLYATLAEPNDALANSQLGLTYFALDNYPFAIKYLDAAKRIDPAHFSYPQLTLAAIYLRQHDRQAAAREYEEFLKYHPDAPNAARIRIVLNNLRAGF